MIRVIQEPAFSEMFVAHLLARSIRVEGPGRSAVQFERSAWRGLFSCWPILASRRPESIIAKVSQETLAG